MTESKSKFHHVSFLNRVIRFFPDAGVKGAEAEINNILAVDPDISVANMFMLLSYQKGQGKSHVSAFGDSDEIRKGRFYSGHRSHHK